MKKAEEGPSFPVTLYHKDNGTPEFAADPRHSKFNNQYPITVHTQEDYDRLGPGWHEDPVEAAAWVPPAVEEQAEVVDNDAAVKAEEVLDGNVADVVERILEIDDVDELELLATVEGTGKDRKGVRAAIESRLSNLQDNS
jgi:hypothetical protein